MAKLVSFEAVLEERKNRPRWKKICMWFYHRFPYIIFTEIPYQRKRLKYFWQRGRRGWADVDAYSICDYLPNVMIGMLNQMTEGGITGYTPTLPEGSSDEANEKRWEEILLTILDGFKAADEINNYKYKTYRDETWQRFYRGMNLFKKYFFGLWD